MLKHTPFEKFEHLVRHVISVPKSKIKREKRQRKRKERK